MTEATKAPAKKAATPSTPTASPEAKASKPAKPAKKEKVIAPREATMYQLRDRKTERLTREYTKGEVLDRLDGMSRPTRNRKTVLNAATGAEVEVESLR